MDVLERDPVELSFIDVSDAVVLTPLRAAAGRLQVVFEPIWGKPARKEIRVLILKCDKEIENVRLNPAFWPFGSDHLLIRLSKLNTSHRLLILGRYRDYRPT